MDYYCYVKCNQPHPGFELVSLCPFPTMITITLWAPIFVVNLLVQQVLHITNHNHSKLIRADTQDQILKSKNNPILYTFWKILHKNISEIYISLFQLCWRGDWDYRKLTEQNIGNFFFFCFITWERVHLITHIDVEGIPEMKDN